MPQKSRRTVSGNAPGNVPGNAPASTPASTPGTRRSRRKPVVLPVNYSNEPDLLVVGVDEVGRGPLAGSVVAAAVILNPDRPISGLTDSKLLTPAQRQDFDSQIREQALGFAIAEASVEEIDQINILHASMLAMKRAVEALTHDLNSVLNLTPNLALIDGNRCPELIIPSKAIVKGDQRYCEISAASIIAKVARDRMMHELHDAHPQYGFDSHKGYPTRQHFAALAEFGVLPQHRRSFGPVRAALDRLAGGTLSEPIAG